MEHSIKDPVVMYLIVRESLQMSIGKTAAQVGHAVSLLFQKYIHVCMNHEYMTLEDEKYVKRFADWLDEDYRKIVLSADEKEWLKIKDYLKSSIDYTIVIDNGLTELAPKTETVIGLLPMLKSQAPKLIKRLQLL